MTGWLIYEREEARRNQGAIQLYIEAGAKYGLKIQLKYREGIAIRKSLPDFVINRSRDWKLGEWFEHQGVRVFNKAEVTRIGNDKYEAYCVMEQLDIPILPFQLGGENKACELPKFPFVLKSRHGHGGNEVFWIGSEREYEEAVQKLGNQSYVMQHPATEVGKDVRLFVINNQVRAAMLRTSLTDFRSNYSLGGRVEPWKPDAQCRQIADQIVKKITRRFHLDYAGIDLIFHEGKPVFNELEDMVGARMLYQHTEMDIISEFVAYISGNENS